MRVLNHGGFTLTYNGDLSGTVCIVDVDRVVHVEVPGDAIKAIVLNCLRDQAIGVLEQASPEDLADILASGALGWLTPAMTKLSRTADDA